MESQNREWNQKGLILSLPYGAEHGQQVIPRLSSGKRKTNDRRLSARWIANCCLDGWFARDYLTGNAIPLVVIDFAPGGVGVILYASASLQEGQWGDLITQSHGRGCHHRPVCCRNLRPHPFAAELQLAGFSFESNPQHHA